MTLDIKYVPMTVTVKQMMGDDELICDAARCSTLGEEADEYVRSASNDQGLISFLMKNRHGSPFAHGAITFIVKAPLFVWREHMRHTVHVSYNEESGRYRKLKPEFYKPEKARTQTGKAGHYEIVDTDDEVMNHDMSCAIEWANIRAYKMYEEMLRRGIAREVARMVLPVNIMSTAYVTFNPRSLMNFLSLRVDSPTARFQTKPQREINMVADEYERVFAELWPWTHRAFEDCGRVAP